MLYDEHHGSSSFSIADTFIISSLFNFVKIFKSSKCNIKGRRTHFRTCLTSGKTLNERLRVSISQWWIQKNIHGEERGWQKYTVYAELIAITYINTCLENPPNEDILTRKHYVIIPKGGIRNKYIVLFPNIQISLKCDHKSLNYIC